MKCVKCGMDLPDGGRYCSGCGTLNERQVAASPARPRTRPIIYAIAVLAGVGLIALIVAVVLAQQRGQSITGAPSGTPASGESILTAPPGAPGDGNIMAAPPGTEGKGDKTPSATPKPKPTPAMVEYLNFVKKVEEHRQMLLKDTTNALTLAAAGGATQSLLSMIDMASNPDGAQARDPLQDTKDELSRQYKNWLAALEFFDKQAAPPECREFSASYRDVLYREAKAIGDIAVSFNAVNVMNPQDMSRLLNELQKMKRDQSIQQNIDKATDAADAHLTRLADTYDMQKPFDVPREQKTSGNIMGF